MKERLGVGLSIKGNTMGEGYLILKMGKAWAYLHNEGKEEGMLKLEQRGTYTLPLGLPSYSGFHGA